MNNTSPLKERILKFIEIQNITQSEFQRICGLANSQVQNTGDSITAKTANKILAAFPNLNIEWLLYGKGTMLKTAAKEETVAVAAKDKDLIFVPLYNLDVHAGMNGLNDVIDCPEYIERHIVFDGARKDDIAFHVFGDSMIPKYVAGSIVLCREVQCWQEYFGYGSTFVLFLTDGRRLLKTVKKSLKNENENVLCCSFNSAYDSEELPKSLIIKVFKVIGSLTKDDF